MMTDIMGELKLIPNHMNNIFHQKKCFKKSIYYIDYLF